MTRRVALTLGIVALLVVLALGVRAPSTPASSLSRSANGWLATRLYLEGRGDAVELIDNRSRRAGSGVLVTVFPWAGSLLESDVEPVLDHLRVGGSAVVGVSDRGGPQQEALFGALDLEIQRLREEPPLEPRAWFAYQRQTAVLEGRALDRPIEIRAPTWAVVPPQDAEILFEDPTGELAGFSVDQRRGRLIVVPAAVLDNAGLHTDGGASLLEFLRTELATGVAGGQAPAWHFDEYHHGLRAESTEAASYRGTAVMVWIGQLALLYALAVYGLARRFGSSWALPERLSESTARFLRGVARTHRRLGRFNEAAQTLITRTRIYDRRLSPSNALFDQARSVDSGGKLLAFATALHRAQKLSKGDINTDD